jgi:hypothetical protein
MTLRISAILPAFLASFLLACGEPRATGPKPTTANQALECAWPAEPLGLFTVENGSPAGAHRSGDSLFSRWFISRPEGRSVELIRTDLPGLESTSLWTGGGEHWFLGASADSLFIIWDSSEAGLQEAIVLDHQGVEQRRVPLTGMAIRGMTGLRVAGSLYAIADNMLIREVNGAWALVNVGRVNTFASPENAANLVVETADQRLCVLDPATDAFGACVAVPDYLPPRVRLYGVSRAHHHAGTWAMVGTVDPGGTALATSTGGDWQIVTTTEHQWLVNDFLPVEGGLLWLRQESLEIMQHRTIATLLAPGNDAAEIWRVEGQAYGIVPTPCGLAFAARDRMTGAAGIFGFASP